MSIITLYTDGGIRPDISMPLGTGFGGAGCIAELDGQPLFEASYFCNGQTTNQRMELMAAIKGLTQIHLLIQDKKISKDGLIVNLHSDSAYMINCIKDGWWYNWMVKSKGKWANSAGKPVENIDLWRLLLSLSNDAYKRVSVQFGPKHPWTKLYLDEDAKVIKSSYSGLNVNFIKVKGHAGIPLNEKADQLATHGKNGNNYINIAV
jgi:ribonuclease HI